MKVSNTLKGTSCVCGAFLIHFSLGTIYTFGNMSPYIASYLKFKTDDVWIKTGDTVWVLAGTFFFMGSLMAVGGVIGKRIGARKTCMLGCWSMSFNVSITYFTIKKGLWAVFLTYGLGFGFGIGICYSVALAAAMKWFPRKRGLITGIVVGGFGLGSFLFNLIQTGFINPKNIPPKRFSGFFNTSFSFDLIANLSSSNESMMSKEKYFLDESIINRVPMCFVIIGVSYAIIQLIGVILLIDYDASHTMTKDTFELEDNTLDKLDSISHSSYQSSEKEQNTMIKETLLVESETIDKELIVPNGEVKMKSEIILTSKDFSVSQAVKNKMFWILWATFLCNGFVIVTISAVFKSFGQQFIIDDQYFAILGAVGGVCNCLGRVFWGRLLDSFNYRIVMSALTVMLAFTMGTFYCCSLITNPKAAKAVYFIWGCLLFVGLSGTFAILPGATAQCFGSLNLATIYGLIISGLAVASIIGAIVSSFLFKYMQFHGQFGMATISAIISLIMTQFFRPPIPQEAINDSLVEQSDKKA